MAWAGMPASMDSQATWIDSIKNSCQSCHALGSQNIRHPHVKELGEFKNSEEMWERRVQSGQAMNNMALTLGRLGPPRAYKMFADWTDRIAAGELPADKPLTLAAYQTAPTRIAYVEPVAVGDQFPDMPLFLDGEFYIQVPLEETYQATWNVLPAELRQLLPPL